jgi:hypothetical protein
MTTTDIKKNATSIVNYIKGELKRIKEAKAKSPYSFMDTNIHFENDSIYEPKSNGYVDYIVVGGKEFRCTKDLNEVQQVSQQVIFQLDELKKTRGWKNLTYNTKDIYEGVSYYNRKHYVLLDKVSLPDNPCKEYTALQKYINKYGKKVYYGSTYGGVNLGNFELFSARMGGKRGRLWDEYGDRVFLDNKPKKCGQMLEELRKYKGSKDIMICESGEEDYIDPIDRKYSEYHEVECDGEKRKYLAITIKTPAGKVKYQTKIY